MRYYISTQGNHLITAALEDYETFENIEFPNPEFWAFHECNILEYWLARVGITQKPGHSVWEIIRKPSLVKEEFKWFRKVWLRS